MANGWLDKGFYQDDWYYWPKYFFAILYDNFGIKELFAKEKIGLDKNRHLILNEMDKPKVLIIIF